MKVLATIAAMAMLLALAQATPSVYSVDDSCLTPQQKRELATAAKDIGITLSTTVTALDIAAALEKDPTTKANLKLAATVIEAVNVDLVGNLSKIANEACGNCSQIVRTINDTVTALEETLSHIEPDWRNDTAWKVVVDAIADILQIADIICPNRAVHAVVKMTQLRDSCLTPQQKRELATAAKDIGITLSTTVTALDIAAALEKDPATKAKLKLAATVIQAVNVDLVGNLSKIANEACGNCSQVVQTINDTVTALEETLSRIEPGWRNDTAWKVVVEAIADVLEIAKVICPNRALHAALETNRLQDSCLNATQKAELRKIVSDIDVTLDATVTALDIAAAAESDPTTKAKLKLAAKIIEAVDVELVANLTKIADEACGNCSQIVRTINDTVTALEQTLSHIEPDWRNDKVWKVVVDAIADILQIAAIICPSRALHAVLRLVL